MKLIIFFVLCVVSLSVSVVLNQDVNENSIDIYDGVKQKSDNLVRNSYDVLSNYKDKDSEYVSSTVTALCDVINEFFIKQDIRFDILLFSNKNNETIDVVSKIGLKISASFAATIKRFDPDINRLRPAKLKKSAIILVDRINVESFNRLVQLSNIFPKKLKYLIYTFKNVKIFFAPNHLTENGHISQFEYFLVDKNNEELELTTFEWFTETKCNLKTYKVLNTFNRTSQKWQKKVENHEKFKNLHNCMVHTNSFHGFYYQKLNKRKQSFTFNMMDIVAQRRNFKVIRGENHGKINVKFRGKKKKVRLEHNVAMGIFWLTEYKSFHFTTTFAEESVHFMITPGELYTSYEKILMPFDELTWYFLITTFGVAFCSIFVVNLMPKYIQDYLYGEGVSFPSFNIFGTFFGIGQLQLPTANFPRIILMIYILFCLVIRTAYQGVMFEMMTKEMRKSSPQTVDELFEWNFSVNLLALNYKFIPPSTIFYSNVDERQKSLIKAYEVNQMYLDVCSVIFDPEKRFAVNTDMHLFKVITHLCKKPPMLLKEEFVKVPLGIATYKNNFLYEAIEEVMQLTIPTGIPQYWRKYHVWYQHERNHYSDLVEIGAQILRMEDLSFGFIIWLIACAVAVLGFMCEIIVFTINKLKRLAKVEHRKINNANILLPKKPVIIKVSKQKYQRQSQQKKSALDAVRIVDDIHEEFELEISPKIETTRVAIVDEKSKRSKQTLVADIVTDIKKNVEQKKFDTGDSSGPSKKTSSIENRKRNEDCKIKKCLATNNGDKIEKELNVQQNSTKIAKNIKQTSQRTSNSKVDEDRKKVHKNR